MTRWSRLETRSDEGRANMRGRKREKKMEIGSGGKSERKKSD